MSAQPKSPALQAAEGTTAINPELSALGERLPPPLSVRARSNYCPASVGGNRRFGCMTARANLVSIRVAEICAVIMIMILRSEPWRSLATASICDGRGVATVDRVARRREKRRHVSIARGRRLPIERKTNEKKRSVCAGSRPSRPGLLWSIDPLFKFKLAEHRFVKAV
jgi:hypothetical protein